MKGSGAGNAGSIGFVRRGCDGRDHIRFERQDPCQRLAESLQVTTVEHVAWIVKVVDVGIVIPLLASVERSGDTPLRRGNGKIGGVMRFFQCTFMRIGRKSWKTVATSSVPIKI